MAAFQEPEEAVRAELLADASLVSRILARGIHVYGAPRTVPLVFEDNFPGPFDEDATSDALRVASAHRAEVLEALSCDGAPRCARCRRGSEAILSGHLVPDRSLRTAGKAGKIKLNMRGTLRFVDLSA